MPVVSESDTDDDESTHSTQPNVFQWGWIHTTDGDSPLFQEIAECLVDDWKAIQYWVNVGCLFVPHNCPLCGGAVSYATKYNPNNPKHKPLPSACFTFRCHQVQCTPPVPRWQRSIFYQTYFHGARMKKGAIFHFLYLWAQRSTNKMMIQQIGWSPNTVVDWKTYTRDLCAVAMKHCNYAIGGPGIEVQIDESKFGKRKYNKGRRIEGCWVFGGIERIWNGNRWVAGRFFAVPVSSRDRSTLWPIIQKYIRPGSRIISDMWKAYEGLQGYNAYDHATVNHSVTYVDSETGVHTNLIESLWGTLKRWIPVTCYNMEDLPDYFAEETWRWMHKGRVWDALMEMIAQVKYDACECVFTVDVD